MPNPIVWSHLADIDFYGILVSLDKNWCVNVVNKFLVSIENAESQASIKLKQYSFTDLLKKTRKCKFTKYNSAVYREYKKQVQLFIIYDTPQDPKKLSLV